MGPVLRDAAVQAMTLAPDSLLERAPGAGLAVATTPEEDADQTRVQVWSLADRRLLQRTPDTPDAPFVADFKPGYATSDSGGQTWRVYALNDASGRVQVQAAKSTQALRENYVHRLTRGLIFATLMFLLLVAAALGVMRRAFKPVDRAGDMILRRQPQDQTLVPLAGMPPSCGRSSIRSTSCSNASARRSSASVNSSPTPPMSCARRWPRSAPRPNWWRAAPTRRNAPKPWTSCAPWPYAPAA